jgi:multisubunit Na+/H+ antiporter MnhB subunit
MRRVAELAAIDVIALFLFAALTPAAPEGTAAREYVVENGVRETGAVNLVTAIYLGYRVFDTFGETVVLLLAVSGVTFLVEYRR